MSTHTPLPKKITYEQLEKLDRQTHRDIRGLINQLVDNAAGYRYSPTVMTQAVRDPNTFILTARDGKSIVGIGTLIVMFAPSGLYGMVENVVVDARVRSMGIGRALMQCLIAEARRRKLLKLELTSNPSRIAANHLYQSLGFQKRETNPYRLILART
ncbi:MAG: GNAT family N-acetyltransferase [Candidatus Sungiibacteriota bacterium]